MKVTQKDREVASSPRYLFPEPYDHDPRINIKRTLSFLDGRRIPIREKGPNAPLPGTSQALRRVLLLESGFWGQPLADQAVKLAHEASHYRVPFSRFRYIFDPHLRFRVEAVAIREAVRVAYAQGSSTGDCLKCARRYAEAVVEELPRVHLLGVFHREHVLEAMLEVVTIDLPRGIA